MYDKPKRFTPALRRIVWVGQWVVIFPAVVWWVTVPGNGYGGLVLFFMMIMAGVITFLLFIAAVLSITRVANRRSNRVGSVYAYVAVFTWCALLVAPLCLEGYGAIDHHPSWVERTFNISMDAANDIGGWLVFFSLVGAVLCVGAAAFTDRDVTS